MPVALVTGAARGIGRATVLALARRGCDVAVNYRSSEDLAHSVVKEAEALGRRAVAVRADMTVRAQVDAAMDRVEAELGPLDVLVNNAGENRVQPFLEISEADLALMLDINFKTAFLCTQAAGRRMLARRSGAIVNVSSMAGCLARPGSVAYGAAKAAMNSLTLSAAEALAPHVTVNAVAPGFVDTELNAYVPPERRRSIEEQTPARRWASPDEIGETVAFFALGPRFVTGQVLRADGGIGNIYFRS